MRRRSRSGSAGRWAAAGWPIHGWKALGLAGLVGVAATGVVIARAERRRRAYTPDEVRARLHARHAAAAEPQPAATAEP